MAPVLIILAPGHKLIFAFPLLRGHYVISMVKGKTFYSVSLWLMVLERDNIEGKEAITMDQWTTTP